MKQIQFTDSPGVPHRTMADEFLCHRQGSEWWYCTGVLQADDGQLFSFQFTLARVRVYGIQLHILMTAVTDFATGKHYYGQTPIFFGRNVTLTAERVALNGKAEMTFMPGELGLRLEEAGYALSLKLDVVKPAVWHAEDGVLRMGLDDPKERTYYWSYTNLAASGTLRLGDTDCRVRGKAWFDKQGGVYTLTSRWTNWEWFSLRFFDDEEVMLFSFPQDDYQDGTFIARDGSYRRLNRYTITPLDFVEARGKRFSHGWTVTLPGIKDEQYTIAPKVKGQLNLFYFELAADIVDRQGRCAGYCVVELLPGVYNEKISAADVLARSTA